MLPANWPALGRPAALAVIVLLPAAIAGHAGAGFRSGHREVLLGLL
jgi:hypothetical protein